MDRILIVDDEPDIRELIRLHLNAPDGTSPKRSLGGRRSYSYKRSLSH